MKEAQYLAIRHKKVRKANALIQKSRFDLSMRQQKILLYLISQISPNDDEFKEYEFSIPEFCRTCGIDVTSGNNYRDLKEAVQEIRNKSIWVTMPNGVESLLAWVEKARIDGGSGIIQIRLDNDMKPFLLHLKQNYTQYELIFTLHFKSKYSIRLYELIKSIHYQENIEYQREFKVDELRKLLDAEKYQQYKDFKRRVLVTSMKEINAYSDKDITMTEKKTGRWITSVVFVIKSKPTLDVIRIRDEIDKELGTDQICLWDELVDAGVV